MLFLVIFFSSIKTFADAGYAYRFYIKAEVKGKEVKGYFYHYSYDKFDEAGSFYEYLKKTIPNRDIKIFKEIVTINLNKNYDFALIDSNLSFELKELGEIRVLETLVFPVGDRLIMLTNKEFKVINCNKINYKYVFYEGETNFNEICSDLIVSSTLKVDDLNRIKKKIKGNLSNKIKSLSNIEIENGDKYYGYYNQLREELLNKKILLISVCTPL